MKTADVNRDGIDELFVQEETSGHLACIDGSTGEIVWNTTFGTTSGALMIDDVDDDGELDVLCQGPFLYILNSSTGAVKYRKQIDSFTRIMPLLEDIDGDGWKELIYMDRPRLPNMFAWSFKLEKNIWVHRTDIDLFWSGFVKAGSRDYPKLVLIVSRGYLGIWNITTGELLRGEGGSVVYYRGSYNQMYSCSEIVSYDAFRDGYLDIISPWSVDERDSTSYYTCIRALNGRYYNELWMYPIDIHVDQYALVPFTVGDLEGNSTSELVIFDVHGTLHIVNAANGSFLRSAPLGINAFREPTLVDVTNDSVKDILVGTEDGFVVAIDGRTLEILWRYDMGSRVVTPVVVGDLDGDGMAELVVSDAEGDVVAIDGYPRPRAWLESPGPGTNATLYAEYQAYDFTVRAWSGWDAAYLLDMTVELDPDGVGAVLSWDRITGNASLVYGSEHVALDACTTSSDGTNWTVTFSVRFRWSYPHEGPCGVVVGLRNIALRPGGGTFRDVFRVETDVELSGPLTAVGEWQGPVREGDWVRSSERVNLTGPMVIYEGSRNVTAPLNVTIQAVDDGGGVTSTDLGAGSAMELVVQPTVSEDGLVTWVFRLGDLPDGCEDRTNLSFSLRVDATTPEVLDWTPPERTWLLNATVVCTVKVRDLGSGMGAGLAQLRFAEDDWMDGESNKISEDSWSYSVTIMLAEGTDNRIEWRCFDRVGNGPSTTGSVELWVDTHPVLFGEVRPVGWVNDTAVSVSVLILDNTSGVDPESLAYRLEGGDWTSVGIEWDGTNASVHLPLPEGRTMVIWRGRDVADNGPTSSAWHEVLVDRTPPELVDVDPPEGHIFPQANVSFNITLSDGLSGVSPDLCRAVLVHREGGEAVDLDLSVTVTGDTATLLLEGILSEGRYDLEIGVGDVAGNDAIIVLGPYGVDLSPPAFSNPLPGPEDVQPTGELNCSVQIVDAVSGVASVEWRALWPGSQSDGWTEAVVEVSGNGTSVLATTLPISFPPGREGGIEWRAVDNVGRMSTSGEFEVWINRPPEAVIQAPRQGDELRPGTDVTMRSSSSDPDGQALVETWTSDRDGDLGTGSEVLAHLSEGEHVITLRVEDPLGGIDEVTVRVEVVDYTSTRGIWWPLLLVILLVAILLLTWRFASRKGREPD